MYRILDKKYLNEIITLYFKVIASLHGVLTLSAILALKMARASLLHNNNEPNHK